MTGRFERIRKYRNYNKLTIEQLAEKADVSVNLISRLELGNRDDISVINLEKILNALDLNLSDFFEHEELDIKKTEFFNEFQKLTKKEQETYADIFKQILSARKE